MYKTTHIKFYYVLLPLVLGIASQSVFSQPQPADISRQATHEKGRAVYNYYCYQCHSYAGDANTLASSFLQPKPRNFTAAKLSQLSRDQMITTVQHGSSGTAMVSFSSVLDSSEINAVVDYVRTEFMSGEKPKLLYHTPENGWENHERYAAAFPFANGEVALDMDWEKLTPNQKEGKQLFMSACISCHDRARVQNEGDIWDLRPLSYPRKHYTHTQPLDGISGASPYAVHDQLPQTDSLSRIEQEGESLFQVNCAFCHAADGTARNWIGSFLEPHPRDLTTTKILERNNEELRQVVMEGLPGTSMPAWKHLLSEPQVDAIFAYLRHLNLEAPAQEVQQIPDQPTSQTSGLSWRK